MKVLYIDPWCADESNLFYYSTGLASAIGEKTDLTMVCQSHCRLPNNINYKAEKVFFPTSFKMKRGKMRLIVRGIEYLKAYKHIERICIKEHFDVIHIEWLLLYKFDIDELKKLKSLCRLLVLKAHNILPHSSRSDYVEIFKKIYAVPDVVLVHGENLKKEFCALFPEYREKVKVQKHGIYMNHDKSFNEDEIDCDVINKIQKYSRSYLFCGRIDYDKGVDRLVNIWTEGMQNTNSLLIIAGKVNDGYNFDSIKEIIKKCSNIIFIEGFVEDNLLNYLLAVTSLVILPYRDGSMSGVAFTAAEFGKPILSTKFGVIEEYLVDGENSFIVINDDNELKKELIRIDKDVSNADLLDMGKKLKEYFEINYEWPAIGRKLVDEIYRDSLVLNR